ncbi:hypothetical protein Aph01nite_16330 [Acrocarpospora phusangensis]|uniref:Secreted protein n=1 Tax=Acrocarpospora phusangensis TaxID=1070424 RepID=A0A919Q9H9_9ACTN|nr:hypothetical protein [Acrocarpospora phusangensis]GIH23323.1 hypothetical protein Aph01nite_16330 [Acrocarpospora phusangensis]
MRSTKALLCVALAGLVGLGSAAPVQADDGEPYPSVALRLYDDAWYEGWTRLFSKSDYDFDYSDNDEASSVENFTVVAWVLFDDADLRDRRYCIRPGEVVPDLGAPQYKFNDKVSSVLKLSRATCDEYPPFYPGP